MSVLKEPHVSVVAPVYNGESYLLESNNEHGNYSKEGFSLVTLELWHGSFLHGDHELMDRGAKS